MYSGAKLTLGSTPTLRSTMGVVTRVGRLAGLDADAAAGAAAAAEGAPLTVAAGRAGELEAAGAPGRAAGPQPTAKHTVRMVPKASSRQRMRGAMAIPSCPHLVHSARRSIRQI